MWGHPIALIVGLPHRKRRPLAVAETLRLWRGRVAEELDAVIAFWERHSHDTENGSDPQRPTAPHSATLCPIAAP